MVNCPPLQEAGTGADGFTTYEDTASQPYAMRHMTQKLGVEQVRITVATASALLACKGFCVSNDAPQPWRFDETSLSSYACKLFMKFPGPSLWVY